MVFIVENPLIQNLLQEDTNNFQNTNYGDLLSKFENELEKSIDVGLRNPAQSSVKCLPTFVTSLPNQNDEYKGLGLDLGGTNFRVILVDLAPGNVRLEAEKIAISEELMTGSGEELFDFIAESIQTFLISKDLIDEVLPLGFTFSFPLQQDSLNQGILLSWTKGFQCSGVVGEDVGALLQAAMDKKQLKVQLKSILNDTTGTLLSCASSEPSCRIGLIVGTGCNACYLEKIDSIKVLENHGLDHFMGATHMIVNTEWGAFGEYGEIEFLRTRWDRKVDDTSVNPGKQLFEKMVSGMYLGEIVRHFLVELAERRMIFHDLDISNLREKGAFETRFLCEAEYDDVGDHTRIMEALSGIFGEQVLSFDDLTIVKGICDFISRRAANLVAAGIIVLLRRMHGTEDVMVGIDGTLFQMHPHFSEIMQDNIDQVMENDNRSIRLMLSTDGSGKGAAISAAVS